MSETSGANRKEKATKVRRKRERDSVLRPSFAAVRHASNSGQWTEEGGGVGGLFERTADSSWFEGGTSSDPHRVQTFPAVEPGYDFSRAPTYTAAPQTGPVVQTRPTDGHPLTVGALVVQRKQETYGADEEMIRVSQPGVQRQPC